MTRRVVLVAVLATMIGGAASSHEIGTTQVNATFFRNGTWQIEILVDPENLLNRLELFASEPRSSGLPVDEVGRRIEQHAPLFLRNVTVQFDEKVVPPRFRYVPLSNTPGALTGKVLLEGEMPKGARTFRWTYGLPYGSYVLALLDEGEAQPTRQWLEGGAASAPFVLKQPPPPLSRAQTALLYLELGFTHIIPKGLDHILFVLGIFLLSTRLRDVLVQVTAFTIAHSITLALTMYGLVSLSPRIVEPAIALSIAYVGVENMVTTKLHPWRIALVFAFGLLHGMGFAGVLAELGLPRSEFLTALVSFNAGVELGQLSVVATAFLLLASWARKKPWYRQAAIVPISIIIAVTGVYWTVVRCMGT